tara:strand:- start:421 stop:600 length:180 start_codon:yes stop_codon:yes gene_type:complete
MAEYGLFNINGKEPITRKSFHSLNEAYDWFSRLKQMPLDKFKKLFIITKLNENGISRKK